MNYKRLVQELFGVKYVVLQPRGVRSGREKFGIKSKGLVLVFRIKVLQALSGKILFISVSRDTSTFERL